MMREIRRDRAAMEKAVQEVRDLTAGLQENGLYRYYSTQRPVSIGTYPKENGDPVNIVNFDRREPVDGGKMQAWGYLEYSEPLTAKQQAAYELRPAEKAAWKQKGRPESGIKPEPDRGVKTEKKKSVLADLRAKQAAIAGAKKPSRTQNQTKENLL